MALWDVANINSPLPVLTNVNHDDMMMWQKEQICFLLKCSLYWTIMILHGLTMIIREKAYERILDLSRLW